MNPAVSVVMPSFNHRRYLSEAIASVMRQTYRDFELILAEDGSTDGSLGLAKEWESRFPDRIRVFTHEGHRNRGLVKTYETALERVRGSVVAFLESDDVWDPQNLEKKIRILEKHPEVGVVYSRYRPFGWRRGVTYWKIYEAANAMGIPLGCPVDLFPVFLKRNPVASFSHFIVRKHLLDEIPPLKTAGANNDWWMLAHLSARTSFYGIPEFLCHWRIHRLSRGFGRADKKSLWKLRGFFARLYESLSTRTACRQESLSRGLVFLRKLEQRQWTALFEALAHPVFTARFFCYIGLKNLLFAGS